jgi:DtxR family transcriptional regulator, Mn-dependent transcriptional regulator
MAFPHACAGFTAAIPSRMPTPAVEDYLKAIYQLSDRGAPVGTSAIADRLGIAPGSVTGMLKRLGQQGLVEHERYQGARLTEPGRAEAIRTIRRHRVLELFLVEVLGYTWDQVHEEAERLEHAASDQLVDRMARVLGDPEADPHGHPIPSSAGQVRAADLPKLAELEEGERAVLRRVSDEDPEALRYLARLNLVPGVAIEVLERTPMRGPLRIRVGEGEEMIGMELAARLCVERSGRQGRRGEGPSGPGA